jgi:hypothetical protein
MTAKTLTLFCYGQPKLIVKRITFLVTLFCLLLVVSVNKTLAQSEMVCGTLPSSNEVENLNLQGRSVGPIAGWNSFLLPCKKATIRLAFHLIKDGDGTGGFSNTNIYNNILTTLNNQFNQHNIFFVLNNPANPIEIIHSYSLYALSSPGIGNSDGKFSILNENSNTNVIDIYLLANGKFPVHYAADIGATSIVYIGDPNTTLLPENIIVHEMGHCLGLYHTFQGTACNAQSSPNQIEYGGMVENPPGSGNMEYAGNGEIAGDYVWDTWPDPTDGYIGSNVDADCRDISTIPASIFTPCMMNNTYDAI